MDYRLNIFSYPIHYVSILEYSCRFVKAKLSKNYINEFNSCGTFDSFYATLFMTQCVNEPEDENLYEMLIEFYAEEVWVIDDFAIRFANAIEAELFWLLFSRQKVKELERFYKNEFSLFVSAFGNATDFFKFLKYYLGMDRILRQSDILFLLAIFFADHRRPRHLIHALKELKLMRHHYDVDSYRFFIDTIARRIGVDANRVIGVLSVNVNNWMEGAKEYEDK